MTPVMLTRPTEHETPTTEPPFRSGWSMGGLVLAILLPGLAVLAGVVVWAAGQSSGSPAVPVVRPAITQGAGSVIIAGSPAGMKGMTGMTTAPAATGAAATATSTSVTHVPFDAALAASRRGHRAPLHDHPKDEVLDIAPGVRYAGLDVRGQRARPCDPRPPGRHGGHHARQRRGDPAFDRLSRGAARRRTSPFASVPAGGSCISASVPTRRGRSCTTAAPRRCSRTSPTACTARSSSTPRVACRRSPRAYVLVSGEWYLTGDGQTAPATLNFEKARLMQPDYVTFNGYAAQYKDHPLTANPGDTMRFYVVDAGPSLNTDFHVVGTILDRVYLDGTTTDPAWRSDAARPGRRRDGLRRQVRESRHLPVRQPLVRCRRHGRGRPRKCR